MHFNDTHCVSCLSFIEFGTAYHHCRNIWCANYRPAACHCGTESKFIAHVDRPWHFLSEYAVVLHWSVTVFEIFDVRFFHPSLGRFKVMAPFEGPWMVFYLSSKVKDHGLMVSIEIPWLGAYLTSLIEPSYPPPISRYLTLKLLMSNI